MKSNIEVSIVIPAYNAEKYILRCINRRTKSGYTRFFTFNVNTCKYVLQ